MKLHEGTPQKHIKVIGLEWVESPPFIGGNTYHYNITLKNLWSEPVRVTVGLWKEPWWCEGGWNHCILEGFEQKTFRCRVKIPAEQGSYWAYLKLCAYGEVNYLMQIGLTEEIIQSPDAIVPSGEPPSYPNWAGLKNFPVPYSPHLGRVYVEAIRLPMLSPNQDTQGEITVRLLSPLDYEQFPTVCVIGGTEQRCTTDERMRLAASYQYLIQFDYAQLIRITLTKNDQSGLYTIPLIFPKTTERVGSYPITFAMSVMAGPAVGHLMWSPNIRRFHRYVLIGYINVAAPIIKGDFDGDGDIEFNDFVQFAAAYGSETGDPNYNAIGDFDNDGHIDIFDFVQFANVYKKGKGK